VAPPTLRPQHSRRGKPPRDIRPEYIGQAAGYVIDGLGRVVPAKYLDALAELDIWVVPVSAPFRPRRVA
jgi:hypothetical protein